MPYKTILAYLSEPEHVQSILNVAMSLAEKQGAHLVGLHVIPKVPLYDNLLNVEVATEVIERQREAQRDNAEAVGEAFRDFEGQRSANTDWRCVSASYPDLPVAVAEQARTADLTIVGPHDSDPFDAWSGLPARVVLGSGRPVLIIPSAGALNGIGENVLVAWNASREAARAAFDAVPLLQDAKNVTVLVINRDHNRKENAVSAGDDLALALARHGIKAEADMAFNSDINVPDELLSRAADFGSDLLVMGCYGHSRLREAVFGGTTRDILKTMTVPVLMSH